MTPYANISRHHFWCPSFIWLMLVIIGDFSAAQTTLPPTTTNSNIPSTTAGATPISTLSPLFSAIDDSGTTLATADSAVPTTTVATENALDATTEGQASNDAIRASGGRGGYKFESQRNRPSSNQESAPVQGPEKVREKNDEKKSAWKFTRGGNNPDAWSARPANNSGIPQWKKETTQPNSQNQGAGDTKNKNSNQPAYIAWSAGQGNGASGWVLNGAPDGWIPENTPTGNVGWPSADSLGVNPEIQPWNSAGWTDDESSIDNSQDHWSEDDVLTNNNGEGGWNNANSNGWVPPTGNADGWTNASPNSPASNLPSSDSWAPPSGNPPSPNGWAPPTGNLPSPNGWVPPANNKPSPNGWAPPSDNTSPPSGWAPQAGNSLPLNGWAPPAGNGPPPNGWSQTAGSPPPSNPNGWAPPVENPSSQNTWNPPAGNPPLQNSWTPPIGNSPPSNGWVSPQGNSPPSNSWTQPAPPVVNPPSTGWTNTGNNAPVNSGKPSSTQPVNNGGAWVSPDKNGQGWQGAPQQTNPNQPKGNIPPANNANSWNKNSGSWTSSQPTGPQQGNPKPWNSGPGSTSNSWNNEQSNVGGWNDGNSQDQGLSWKVYNEDTHTMENLDENLGWKVVGDGGSEGWKLVDENGNVEWKIENVNGEWKVTSAEESPKVANTTNTKESNNSTTPTNTTTEQTTTVAPGGGWDDDKQNKYIVWKFSEDGKGEARVYGGDGAEPDVWTVGDNNQWWKETVGINEAKNNDQGSPHQNVNTNQAAKSDNNKWNNNNEGKNNQNTQQPQPGQWQNTRNNLQTKNNKWQSGGGRISPQTNGGWKTVNAGLGNRKPETNASPLSGATPTGWQQVGNNIQQTGNNGWQQNGPPPAQITTWNSRGPPQQIGGNWQNPAPQTHTSWKPGNSVQQNANGNWQPTNSQAGRHPGGTSTQTNGGWSNVSNVQRNKPKNKPNGRPRVAPSWQKNTNPNNDKKISSPAGNSNVNNGGSWNSKPQVNTNSNSPSWNAQKTPAPAANTNSNTGSGNKNVILNGWSANGNEGQTVPYIIIIKTPNVIVPSGGGSNPWTNSRNTNRKKTSNNNNKPRSNRRSNGWKMNRAGSSGWQWITQGNNNGWKWNDGWMGSGGGFGGWVNDGDTMYSNWKPTNGNGASANAPKPANKRSGGALKDIKQSGSKMVFVFGKKNSTKGSQTQPKNGKSKKGKQVIIIDYTSGKRVPKNDDGMKKDIESVIQALKSAKTSNIKGSVPLKSTS